MHSIVIFNYTGPNTCRSHEYTLSDLENLFNKKCCIKSFLNLYGLILFLGSHMDTVSQNI
jgi:hypothetical protein